MECNHDINSPNTTIELLERVGMLNPVKFYGVCRECGKSFVFTKKGDEYIKLEETGGQSDETV